MMGLSSKRRPQTTRGRAFDSRSVGLRLVGGSHKEVRHGRSWPPAVLAAAAVVTMSLLLSCRERTTTLTTKPTRATTQGATTRPSSPQTQPAQLCGSDLSVAEALNAGNLRFVAVCKAEDDPRLTPGGKKGTVEAVQNFRVVMALDTGMITGETIRLQYSCHGAQGHQERTIRKGESVIWFVGHSEKDNIVAIKAMAHTLENQLAATRIHLRLKPPVSQWGQAVQELQCGIDLRGLMIVLAVRNVSPKPVNIGYLMKTDKEDVLPTPSLTLELRDSQGRLVPRISNATVKISGPGIALGPGWFCIHFFDVRQYFAVKESGEYRLTARIERFPVWGAETELHKVSLASREHKLLVDLGKRQRPPVAGGPRVQAYPPPAEAPATTRPNSPQTQPAASVGKRGARPGAGGHVAAPEKQAARWSKTVNGLQARLTLKRSEVLNGTPIISTYLNLRNVSDVGNPMKINWKNVKRTFRVVDERGKELPKANGPYDGRIRVPGDIVLPHNGALALNITQSGRGIPSDKAGLICLGVSRNWVFERDGKAYYLHAVLEVPVGKAVKDDKRWPWHGRIEIPPVMVPLKPVPVDPAKLAELIQKLGSEMLATNTAASEKAARALSLIEDERVIPWYIKAINTHKYDLKFVALDRLCRFRSDEALGGLKKGMTTQGSDIANCTTDAVAAQMAENIRHAAACALSRSPHPKAKPLLLSMWNDPSNAVRITVLHALGKMDSEESLQMLKRMSKDSDERVGNEALRYLKLRTTQPAPAA